MCGIVGYIGKRKAAPILLEGLRRLEYRGYDSAGMALGTPGRLHVAKRAGKVEELAKALSDIPEDATIGIAHTRWATHGAPNEINAHPHVDGSGKVAVVHNGIIENYTSLKDLLCSEGVTVKHARVYSPSRTSSTFCTRASGVKGLRRKCDPWSSASSISRVSSVKPEV